MGFFSNKQEVDKAEVKTVTSKSLYCIDFENVGDSGIIGISKLGKDDEVVIFYGSNNNSISFNSHEMIVLANCQTTIMKCDKSAKNYLDFQLVSFIGMRLGKEQYSKVVIVSKDMGFDSVVDFWSKENVAICRQEAIDASVKSVAKLTATRNRKKPEQKKSEKVSANKSEGKAANKQEATPKAPSTDKTQQPAAPKSGNKKTLSESTKKKVRGAVKELELKPTQYTMIYNTILKSKTVEDYQVYINKRLGNKGSQVFEKTKDIFAEFIKD